ncbi:hypothetical protein J6590_002289 [Homalodisca vitripennis]|nr:hypothetical protein J6590_002289 [Homalodisca vitripennis]
MYWHHCRAYAKKQLIVVGRNSSTDVTRAHLTSRENWPRGKNINRQNEMQMLERWHGKVAYRSEGDRDMEKTRERERGKIPGVNYDLYTVLIAQGCGVLHVCGRWLRIRGLRPHRGAKQFYNSSGIPTKLRLRSPLLTQLGDQRLKGDFRTTTKWPGRRAAWKDMIAQRPPIRAAATLDVA